MHTTHFPHFTRHTLPSGLTAYHIPAPGPLVHGTFALATEAFDDKGCPHVLEHLVFMGSKKYPYKGVLDKVANRCIARGTNAWTATDHTAYTISTGGYEGFLQIMPVFLDHILQPTLTDAAFHTEVHHLNEELENAGVVYCEMQGRESSESDIIYRALMRELFDENSGYRSETGGMLKDLRVLDNKTIKQYHADYYRPKNLCLIITGTVPEEQLIKTLQNIDDEICIPSEKGKPELPRPWHAKDWTCQRLSGKSEISVEFPEQTEDVGKVLIGWKGPAYSDFRLNIALEIFGDYLSDSAVSILQSELVEIADPFCTNVGFESSEYRQTIIYCSMSSVPLEKLETLPQKFWSIIESIPKVGIDQERMDLVIRRKRLEYLEMLETAPDGLFAESLIANFLYAEEDNVKNALSVLEHLDSLGDYDWIALVKDWFINNGSITVKARPSIHCASVAEAAEKERLAAQRQGRDGNAEKAMLEAARAENEKEIPSEIIESFQIPQGEIPRIQVMSARNNNDQSQNALQKQINAECANGSLFFIQFDHINSEFIQLAVSIDTSSLANELRPYLLLYSELLLQSPINRNGTLIDFEDVVKGLNEDTLSYSCSFGLNHGGYGTGPFGQLLFMQMKVERTKYELALNWLRDAIFNSVFTQERTAIIVSKLLNDIPSYTRDGSTMAAAALRNRIFTSAKSNTGALNILRQMHLLKAIQSELETSPHDVLKRFKLIRQQLLIPSNLMAHVSGGLLPSHEQPALYGLASKWESFMPASAQTSLVKVPRIPNIERTSSLVDHKIFDGSKGHISSLASIESSFSYNVVPGPSEYADRDILRLEVLQEYLTTMEGLFWKEIRGQGLAYSCDFMSSIETGLTYFTIYRSPDASKAFEQAKKIIESLISGKLEFTEPEMEAAKSSVLFSLLSAEDTMAGAAFESFHNQVLKGQPIDNMAKRIDMLRNIKISDIRDVLMKWYRACFDPKLTMMSVMSAPAKVEAIKSGFRVSGFDMEKHELSIPEIDVDSQDSRSTSSD